MARMLLLLALCVLPALVRAARPARNPFVVQGSVYCDTCLAGFETSKTTNIAGNHFIFRSDVSMASHFYILLNISEFISCIFGWFILSFYWKKEKLSEESLDLHDGWLLFDLCLRLDLAIKDTEVFRVVWLQKRQNRATIL